MKQTFLVIILLQFSVNLFSQKEVYFSNKAQDSIKVQSMHGVELSSGYNLLSLFHPASYINNSFSIPLNMCYFNEKRIASNWTLTTRIGLSHSFVKQAQYTYSIDTIKIQDSTYYSSLPKINGYQYGYQLRLNLGIEPRWYLDFQHRYERGKAKLNSGLFLSLPVSYNLLVINTYIVQGYQSYYTNYRDYGNVSISILLGYRQAISSNWFLEGSLNTIGNNITLLGWNKQFQAYSRFYLEPTLSLKAAYTFK